MEDRIERERPEEIDPGQRSDEESGRPQQLDPGSEPAGGDDQESEDVPQQGTPGE